MVFLYTPIFQCSLKPCFPFCLVHFPASQTHIGNADLLLCHLFPHLEYYPLVSYPFISRKFYACLCGRKSHLFQSVLQLGKTSANSRVSISSSTAEQSFKVLKAQAKLTFNLLTIVKGASMSCSALQLFSHRLTERGTIP